MRILGGFEEKSWKISDDAYNEINKRETKVKSKREKNA